MIQRRNLAAERMVAAAKRPGLFQRKNVGRLFCDTEQISRSRWVSADFTHFAGCKEPAQIAGMNRLTRIRDGARNLLRLIATLTDHPECDPLRGTRTDARHLPQLRN